MQAIKRFSTAALLGLGLGVSGVQAQEPVVVSSKDTVQDRILAEMMVLMLDARGLAAERRIGVGDSADVFQALRSGAVDVYPEYTGTALALLDGPPETDAEMVRARLAAPFADLGLEFLNEILL